MVFAAGVFFHGAGGAAGGDGVGVVAIEVGAGGADAGGVLVHGRIRMFSMAFSFFWYCRPTICLARSFIFSSICRILSILMCVQIFSHSSGSINSQKK